MNPEGKMRGHIAWMAIFMMAASGCHARQRMLDGIVRQSGETPCFTVPTKGLHGAKTLRVAAIEINEITEGGAVISTPWSAGMSDGIPATSLTPDTCISYGSIRGQGEPTALTVGKRYAMFINADVGPRDRGENRRYSGYFCLTQSADAERVVHQVKWDKRAQAWGWDACGIDDSD